MSYLQENSKPVTLFELGKMRAEGRKIVMLTGYDASFAALLERCGVDVILVGDSLGNVLQGQKTTLPVTMEQMAYHTECVARGSSRPLIVTDMPFGSYAESPSQAMRNAARPMAAGAHMVKLEGGAFMAETVRFLVERGVPVCAHIGLTPQAGLVLALLSAYGLSGLKPSQQKTATLATLSITILLTNTLPENQYASQAFAGWSSGPWLNLRDLANFSAVIWPFTALLWVTLALNRRVVAALDHRVPR